MDRGWEMLANDGGLKRDAAYWDTSYRWLAFQRRLNSATPHHSLIVLGLGLETPRRHVADSVIGPPYSTAPRIRLACLGPQPAVAAKTVLAARGSVTTPRAAAIDLAIFAAPWLDGSSALA